MPIVSVVGLHEQAVMLVLCRPNLSGFRVRGKSCFLGVQCWLTEGQVFLLCNVEPEISDCLNPAILRVGAPAHFVHQQSRTEFISFISRFHGRRRCRTFVFRHIVSTSHQQCFNTRLSPISMVTLFALAIQLGELQGRRTCESERELLSAGVWLSNPNYTSHASLSAAHPPIHPSRGS